MSLGEDCLMIKVIDNGFLISEDAGGTWRYCVNLQELKSEVHEWGLGYWQDILEWQKGA